MNKAEEKKREVYYANDLVMPPECDKLCRFRKCYHKSENKGSFSVGRGYTSYHEKFYPSCGVRMCHGCPDRDGNVDLNKAFQWIHDMITGKKKEREEAKRTLKALQEYVCPKEDLPKVVDSVGDKTHPWD